MATNDSSFTFGSKFSNRKNNHKHEKRFTRYMYHLDGFGKLLVILSLAKNEKYKSTWQFLKKQKQNKDFWQNLMI